MAGCRHSRTTRRATPLGTLLAVLLMVGPPPELRAAPEASAEEVKAAFLYHFGKFVEWPRTAFMREGSFVIGILGAPAIADALERTVREKLLQDKRIDVRRLRSAAEAPGCQMLFIGAGERDRLSEILKTLDHASVLTVSDMEGFIDREGMISLVIEQNKIRFEINRRAVEQAGLKMSSQLLKLARRVIATRA